MIFDDAFKKALQQLPQLEKDKLILKLLKKDLTLANRLYFELVNTDTVEDKRNQVIVRIQNRMVLTSERFFSMGYLLMDVRELSGVINEHVNITKDKYGEIVLTCELLIELLQLNNQYFGTQTYQQSYTLCIYIIAKIFKVLTLINKQHEDLLIEFKEGIVKIGKLVGNIDYLMRTAINNGLEVNWLLKFEIPSNIDFLVKNIRKQGFLK